MESLITFENVDFCCGMQKLLVFVLLLLSWEDNPVSE